jgi:hypothetical protein
MIELSKQALATLMVLAIGCTPLSLTPATAAGLQKDRALPAQPHVTAAGFVASDALFAHPYIDVDETRHDGPLTYRHVHGGFEGTDTRYSFYLPTSDKFGHRFFQYITPVPDSETLSQGLTGSEDRIGAALTSGGYFIETNGGGPKAADPMAGLDPTIGAWRANAAAAQFSRWVARQVYGEGRVYGYVYGGSGGAYRTIGSIENTHGVWDGAVPYVVGSPMAIPGVFTVRLMAMRVLGSKLDGVVDALDAGGSGDPTAHLNAAEKSALAEVTRMGFQPQSWYAWRTMGPHAFALLFGGIRMVDAPYFKDFWEKPGYDGHDHPELYTADRVQLTTTIAQVITAADARRIGLDIARSPGTAKGTADLAWQAMGLKSAEDVPVAFRLRAAPGTHPMMLSDLVLASGKKIGLTDVQGDIAIAGINDPRLLASAKEGDPVRLDNSDILAVETYHRHQVPPGNDYPVWDQFRGPDGKPLYPQRPMLLGPLFTKAASGTLPTGKFDGKMILLENLWDREAYPWQGDWYRQKVAANAKAAVDDTFRIWYTDRALHGDQAVQDDPSRVVSYLGVLQQALRDLSAWVERGTAPPPSTQYRIENGQVIVSPVLSERGGLQPLVTVSANGQSRVEIAAKTRLALTGSIAVPPGAGEIVAAQWDFEGTGKYDAPVALPASPQRMLKLTASHLYARSGTYFAVLRAVSQRQGDRKTAFGRIENLARLRVIVR